MVRLIIAIVIALMLGVGIGVVEHRLSYDKIDERFGELRAATTPVAAATPSERSSGEAVEASSQIAVVPRSDQAPKVQIAGGTTHDFGTMQQGSKKSHSFMFKNIGNAPLKLEVAGSSCRCTIGTLADSMLEPGEETAVTLEWKATGVLDEFSQTATIATNDPDHRAILLSVRGIVARTILVEPPSINFGDVPVAQGATRTAFIFGYGEVPLEVRRVAWGDERSANMVDIKVTPMEIDTSVFKHHERAKGAARVDVTLKAGMTLGPINSRLIVDTNIENVSDVDLPVTGAIVGDIQFLAGPSFEADKNVLNFGTVRKGAGASINTYLSVQGDYKDTLTVEVGEVVPAESLKVTVGEAKKQLSRTIIPITCTIPEQAPEAMFPGTSSKNFGKVIFKTNHPDIPEIKLNIRMIVE